MRGYLKLFAVLCVAVVCFVVLRTERARDLWLNQKLAWAKAYGSPADVQRALDEVDAVYFAEAGNAHLIAFRQRRRHAIERLVAAGMSREQAVRVAAEEVGGKADGAREHPGDGCTCGDEAPVRGADGTYTCAPPASGDGAASDISRPCPRRATVPAAGAGPDDRSLGGLRRSDRPGHNRD